MRSLLASVALGVACLLSATAAHADQIYSLNLTASTGNAGNGTGSFEINLPPLTGINQQSTYKATNTSGDILENLSFTIDGHTFTLANINSGTASNTFVQFTTGSLNAVEYAGNQDTSTVILSLSAAGLQYTYDDSADGHNGTGNISVTNVATVSNAPEPSSLALLGTGLLTGCAMLRRRLA